MNAVVTSVYAQRFPNTQEFCEEPVEILNEDWIVAPVAEACAFQRRLENRLTFSQLRQHICMDWELGCVDAKTTMKRLHEQNLLGNPDQFMAIFNAGVRSLAERGR